MSGIEKELTLDTRHIAKHLPDTPQMQRLLQREGFVHVFNDEATMLRVAQAIIENGEFTGIIRNHERYGLYFASAIGYRIDINGSQIPLHYGEIKLTGDKYHVIPRTRPSQ
ncbi:hypothetical protein [Dolichospermum sp. UHCC 0259]|uniref:DUF6972 family protein n=1 Tax=Dolichospermum sp. UHCC 0259 TaxID=2590010 RepID=UPI0014467699|nr:hypothetical protein [Dolichospermum sp. UHCC 0259]MTJ49797.1 hypothetical protein [Dolichospermum sp. UHCC 0259]